MNNDGYRETLQPRQPENTNAVRNGVYSRRTLAPRAREIADQILELKHTVALDRIGAEEIGSLVALLEAIDQDLQERGLIDRRGNVRSMVDLRNRVSGRLQRWLREFGATPASRLEWVERFHPRETLEDVVRTEVAEGMRLLEAAQSRGDIPAEERGS